MLQQKTQSVQDQNTTKFIVMKLKNINTKK